LAVGLASAALEAAGEHGPVWGHHDDVPGREVPGAAHDLLLLVTADVHQAEADGLLESLQLLDAADAADGQRTGDLREGLRPALDLQAHAHEARVELGRGH